MTGQDIIVTRGLVYLKQLGSEHTHCIKLLYVALSPAARKKLVDLFTLSEINLLEQFVAENYAQVEKEGYKVDPEKREAGAH